MEHDLSSCAAYNCIVRDEICTGMKEKKTLEFFCIRSLEVIWEQVELTKCPQYILFPKFIILWVQKDKVVIIIIFGSRKEVFYTMFS